MTPQESEVLQADERRFDAMRREDWPALDAALADDLTYVHSTARLESKAEHIGNLRARKPQYRGIAPRDRKVRVHGGIGIVKYMVDGHGAQVGCLKISTGPPIRYPMVHNSSMAEGSQNSLAKSTT